MSSFFTFSLAFSVEFDILSFDMDTFPISDLVTQIVSERGLARDFVIETLKESLLAGVKSGTGQQIMLPLRLRKLTGPFEYSEI